MAVFILLLSAACSSIPGEMTADKLIAGNMKARGGQAAWENVESLKIEGEFVSFSEPGPYTIWRQRPDLYRFDCVTLRESTTHVYDGENAWWINPTMGEPYRTPGIIPEQYNLNKVTLRERFFEPVFWNHEEKNHTVRFMGKETVDGIETYNLEVMLADSTMENWFFDTKTFLEKRMTGKTYDFGIECNLETFFNDYREVDGILFPHFIEAEYGNRYISYEAHEIQINPEIEPSVFKMP